MSRYEDFSVNKLRLGPNAIVQNTDIEIITASKTLTYEESGKTIMIGADALVVTLPATKAGIRYKFVNDLASTTAIITISPAAADGIFGTVTLAASVVAMDGTADKDLINTKATSVRGDSCELIGDGVDGWMILSSTGIWAQGA